MAQIVAAAAASHAPGIIISRNDADPEQAGRFYAGLDRIAATFQAAKPDTIVMITNEHFANFYLDNVPAICIGTGAHHRGPAEIWLGEEVGAAGDRPFARALLANVLAQGCAVSFSEDLTLDHGSWVPLFFVNPGMAMPVVPIVVNNLYEPMLPPKSVYEFGKVLRTALDRLPPDHRVALLATGGLSHKVGTPDAGDIDAEFDRGFLEGVARGEGERLAELTHAELDAIGNGTHEVRNWLCVMGALGATTAEVVAYEPIDAWLTGCGAAIWHV